MELQKREGILKYRRGCYVPNETIILSAEPLESIIFTQPGMRYCQAQALVHALTKDKLFASLSEQEKIMVSERILEEVRGRMMEEIVLLETFKSAKKNKRVFKLIFSVGEFLLTEWLASVKDVIIKILSIVIYLIQQFRLWGGSIREWLGKDIGE